MRILYLSQFFDPEPFFKALPFVKELVKQGHEVEVLTGFPNYPDGKVYPGHRIKLFSREKIEGISIIRVALYPSHDQSALRRILNYGSFALTAGLLGPCLVRKADVAYVYHPPPTVGFPAIMLHLLRGIPFVYDVQDLWPDSLEATQMIQSRPVLAVVARWCALVYRFASAIVVLSPGLKERLISRGVPAEKINVIYNWSAEQISPATPQEAEKPHGLSGDRFNIVFAGNMGPAQALDFVLDAAGQLKSKAPNVQFVFVGSGISADRLKENARNRNIDNVTFLPRVSPAEAQNLLRGADALLVHLKDDPLFSITIPSKIQAYLAAGKPILIGVKGDAARLVESAQAGLAFQPEDPGSLVNVVERLCLLPRSQQVVMGGNGRRFYERELSLPVGAAKFEALFSSLIAPDRP